MFAKKNGITTTLALAAMALPALSQSEDSGNNELSVQALSSAGAGVLVFDPQTFQGGNGQTRARSFMAAEALSTSRVTCSCALNVAASSTTLRPIAFKARR